MALERIGKIVTTVEVWLFYLAMALIFILGLVTGIHVVGRYVFSSPIKGSVEANEIGLLLMTFLAASYTMRLKGHVGMDLGTVHFSRRLGGLVHSVTNLLCVLFLGFLSYQIIRDGFWQWQVKTTIMNLDIVLFPIYFVCGFSSLLFAIEVLIAFWDSLSQAFRN